MKKDVLELNMQLDTVGELLENVLGCFIKRDGRWFSTKTNDGEWVPVGEDLQDYLEEAEEYVDAHVKMY